MIQGTGNSLLPFNRKTTSEEFAEDTISRMQRITGQFSCIFNVKIRCPCSERSVLRPGLHRCVFKSIHSGFHVQIYAFS